MLINIRWLCWNYAFCISLPKR